MLSDNQLSTMILNQTINCYMSTPIPREVRWLFGLCRHLNQVMYFWSGRQLFIIYYQNHLLTQSVIKNKTYHGATLLATSNNDIRKPSLNIIRRFHEVESKAFQPLYSLHNSLTIHMSMCFSSSYDWIVKMRESRKVKHI